MHDTEDNKHGILPKIEDVSTAMETSTDRPLDDVLVTKFESPDDETIEYQSFCFPTGIKTEPESIDESNEIYFDPKEWLIKDDSSGKIRAPRQNEFLYFLLEDSRYSSYLSWLDRNEGLFKIHQPERVIELWTKVKNRQTNGTMDYDTFARGLRYYYQLGTMIKTHRKYTFRFKMLPNGSL